MTGVCKEIFKAIHEGKWLSIEYRNKQNNVTKYWICVKSLDPIRRSLEAYGLHLSDLTVKELYLYIDSIQQAKLVEGSYCERNQKLIDEISLNPSKYRSLFDHVPNLKILNYFSDCNKLNTTPYRKEHALIHCFDQDSFTCGVCKLNTDQFKQIVDSFQLQTTKGNKKRAKQLGLNEISIPCKQGLYVLAYRKLFLDVSKRSMIAEKNLTFCREFTIDGEKVSIRQFLEPDELWMLEEPQEHLEEIKDAVTRNNPQLRGVDDMPYVIALEMDCSLDLETEYASILDMYNNDTVTAPIHAFFGELLNRPVSRKQYPLALLNRKVNLDQLLAINNAMHSPLAYIQGPPGTGKTNTIMNTIMTAFFNGKTILFSSNNNHPIDEVFKKMRSLKYKDHMIPLPIVRLGNTDVVGRALDDIRLLYESTKNLTIYDSTLTKNRDTKVERTKKLSKLLSSYEKILDLQERKEVTQRLLDETHQMNFRYELSTRQMAKIEADLQKIGEIKNEDVFRLLEDDEEEFLKYLYFTSAKYIRRLSEPKNKELLDIILSEEETEERVKWFNDYLGNPENVRLFLRIFPMVATTNISVHRIGSPGVYFDMVIMDEASQCTTAVALVPILRGEKLMLVGDPQQLQPVILLDPADNRKLRRKYAIGDEYDYINNSVYKVFLACDAVSDEILLSYHYRCHKRIINFNNKKYYDGQLKIESSVESETPLVFVDVKDAGAAIKNTAPGEAAQIVRYIREHPDLNIGVITPFANQKEMIEDSLKREKCDNITCGTVHAFQGDEKDVILFSLGLTDATGLKTYEWLKNNRELINVATSRARRKLIVFGSEKNLRRLHGASEQDDLFELFQYIKSNGKSVVTPYPVSSRALGVKPYSTETEAAFMENLNHAIDNIRPSGMRYSVKKEVPISQIFLDSASYNDLFYTGRFDFVVYEKGSLGYDMPVLAIELDGKEHYEDEVVKLRDSKKNQICQEHDFELIRVDNSYARRYHYIKSILMNYFNGGRAV